MTLPSTPGPAPTAISPWVMPERPPVGPAPIGAPQFGRPGAGSPPPDVVAVLGFAGAFAVWPAGLALSILALRRTRTAADRTGHGLAVAGIVVAAAHAIVSVLGFLIWGLAMVGSLVALVLSTSQGVGVGRR